MTRRKEAQKLRNAEAARSSRIAKLIDIGWITDPNQIPSDAVPVDPSLLNIGGSWDRPTYYRDKKFHCKNCGCEQVWLAEDQLWYYEVVQGFIHRVAVRCRDCRKV
ncbi:MAG: hypothetical protein GY948_18450, partial [Alphaproteobacteria bacterium]|nr:hypothetical protein [Alphaproteobacteria bacterium]